MHPLSTGSGNHFVAGAHIPSRWRRERPAGSRPERLRQPLGVHGAAVLQHLPQVEAPSERVRGTGGGGLVEVAGVAGDWKNGVVFGAEKEMDLAQLSTNGGGLTFQAAKRCRHRKGLTEGFAEPFCFVVRILMPNLPGKKVMSTPCLSQTKPVILQAKSWPKSPFQPSVRYSVLQFGPSSFLTYAAYAHHLDLPAQIQQDHCRT